MSLAVPEPTTVTRETVDWRGRLYRFYNSQVFVAFLFLLVPVLLLTALKNLSRLL